MSAGTFSTRIFLQSFYFLYTFQKLINSLLLKIFFPPLILRFLYYPEDIFFAYSRIFTFCVQPCPFLST